MKSVLSNSRPTFAFLSEPQLFQCDAKQIFKYLDGEYCWHLNSDDLLDPELPLVRSKSHGGTLMLWLRELDPYIEVINTTSTAFLPIVLKMPDLKISIHVSIYMPTHGKDAEFVSDLADLRNCLDDLHDRYIDPIVYIRGDGNVNANNRMRVTLLKQFISDYKLAKTEIGHTTYHHFVGNGSYDSMIDVLLHTSRNQVTECVNNIMCVHDYPDLLSHHDMIISSFTIPTQKAPPVPTNLVRAPKCDLNRTKIIWSIDGQKDFSELVGPYLRQAREKWLDANSQTSMSVLLSITNSILSKCATVTNQHKTLGTKLKAKSQPIPKLIKSATNKMIKAHKKFKQTENSSNTKPGEVLKLKATFNCTKKRYRQVVRQHRLRDSLERYQKLDDIFEKPSTAFSYLRSCRKTKPTQIEQLSVGDKLYAGSAVCDGFYDSMTSLKQCDIDQLRNDPHLSDQFTNYDHIMKICRDQPPIPPISLAQSTKILESLKKKVNDFYSISSLHYLNAGEEGLLHYNHLLNAIITDVNNAKVEEMNVAHGNILYKGHNKEKTSDRSYRTISTCPLLAKSVDFYFRDLYLDKWNQRQAVTQYQGSGSSHDLASLLVTEVIQYSLYTANRPVFLLALDAQSAFDRCLREILCCELYKAEVPGSAIIFMNNRLASRKTVYEWDGNKMGPAEDITGFEQGGINSSDYYKLYNNEQLDTAQSTNLGADIGSDVISAVGQADDVMLMSNDLNDLHLLVRLTEQYCQKYRVKLEPKKTKLLGYATKSNDILLQHAVSTNQITISSTPVKFTNEVEHVGVIRNTDGNMPNIVQRISKHKKALGSIMSAGIARGHRGSPAAALRVHEMYCTPKLFSGLATLVLSKTETQVIESHYKNTLQNLQRLHRNTPRSIVYFLAGSLPGEAQLHLRQLSLFSMICHLPEDPLHSHAKYCLTTLRPSSQSWFFQIRTLCHQYHLPHPLVLLDKPFPKEMFKKRVKLQVTEYWQEALASECLPLQSLRYFDPHRASLQHPHPMWTSAAGNSYECCKSTIWAKMVSGRYRTEMMCSYWSKNRNGYCLAETCYQVQGDLEHLLVTCPALDHVRHRLHSLWCLKTRECPPLHSLILQILGSHASLQVKFILDATSCPELIHIVQIFGQPILELVMYLTRTWTFSIHRQKMILLGRWPEKTAHRGMQTNTCPDPQSPINSHYRQLNLDADCTTNTNTNPDNIKTTDINLNQPSDSMPINMTINSLFSATSTTTLCSDIVPEGIPISTPPYYDDRSPDLLPGQASHTSTMPSVTVVGMTDQRGGGGQIVLGSCSGSNMEQQQPVITCQSLNVPQLILCHSSGVGVNQGVVGHAAVHAACGGGHGGGPGECIGVDKAVSSSSFHIAQ